MDTKINQQVAMDEALVHHAQRLRIGRSNFCLLSDIKSKESTLQLVYDVMRLCPFFKAFLVTADVPEIYMQEFWATTTVHHHAIRFKMDNKKHIVNLESFRDMLHICLRVHGQSFVEPPFEEEIIAFIRFLGHRATPPRPKASVRKTRSSSDTTITPPTAVAVHHHSIRFKMDNKKHIAHLESFREVLHIFPRLPHQPFVEPPFKEEILAFLCFLGHNTVNRKLTDVNINKLHQPWRAFAAIINM
nr:hypothetical protein [Tanacetum cinerariifolium]